MPDAVIIGAGLNSLACACHLAARGWSVEVFEQAQSPGGAVKTGQYTEPGFDHDWAAMNLSLFASSSFYAKYSTLLAEHGLEFAHADRAFATLFPDGRWLGVSKDFYATANRIRAFSESDADAWEGLTRTFEHEARKILPILGLHMNKYAIAKLLWHLRGIAGVGGTMDLARFLTMSPRNWLAATFENPQVRATLAAWGMHLDFAPDVAGGAVFTYLEAMAGQAFGMVLARGGAGTAIDAMIGMLKAHGGKVHCNAMATRILSKNGQALGIELADGRHIKAKKAVIANVAPGALAKLTGHFPNKRYVDGLKAFRHAPGTMMIHLSMDDLPDWPVAELRKFAYVHLAPSLEQMSRTYAQANAGLLPDEPVIVCGQPTVVDSSRAPNGKHVIWLQVRMVPGKILGDSKGEIAATDWDDVSEPFADRVLGILESYAPGTSARIREVHVVTPRMFEADNPNLVGGDQICGSHQLYQNFHNRPVRGFADGSTPIRNLYHTGAAVWPGAGTGAGSGTMLAQKLAGK